MQHQQAHIAVLTAFVCVQFLFSGCTASSRPRVSPVSTIVSSLRESHPNGISATAAQEKMEQNGFQCEMVRDGTFVHKIRDPEGSNVEPRQIQHIDFIECHRKTQSGWVTSFDTVALILDGDTVVDILSNWEAVGP